MGRQQTWKKWIGVVLIGILAGSAVAEYPAHLQRFAQRDPLGSVDRPVVRHKPWAQYDDGMSVYVCFRASPASFRDPHGTKTAGRCCNSAGSSCNLEIRTEDGGSGTLQPGECGNCDAIVSTSNPNGGEPTYQDPCPGSLVFKVVDGCTAGASCSAEGYYATDDVSCCAWWRYLVQAGTGGCVERWW